MATLIELGFEIILLLINALFVNKVVGAVVLVVIAIVIIVAINAIEPSVQPVSEQPVEIQKFQ